MQVCGAIFRMDSNANGPGVRYVWEHPEILDLLFQGCEHISAPHGITHALLTQQNAFAFSSSGAV